MTQYSIPLRPWLPIAALVVAALAAGIVLMLVNPFADGSFLPPCPLHELTGLYCPGCGTTRALHALLHGSVPLALSMNPLAVITVLAIPVMLWNSWRPGHAWMARISDARIWLVLVVAFAVLRNLPWEPFVRLAPG
ncbi:DUF2752 domain-containing protein [Dokdonella sp.]|uniref:DUF2752 domain-containing protein n=1 Tax=Dokdonella sp. TaxID=2291710 RepID=UPI0035288FF6